MMLALGIAGAGLAACAAGGDEAGGGDRPVYEVRKAEAPPPLDAGWDAKAWKGAETAEITHFHAESSTHHPRTQVRMLYDDAGLYLMFRVEDQYVRAVHTDFQDPVCQDACVEFFVAPKPDKGYFNFELNCIGTLLLWYVPEPEKWITDNQPVKPEVAGRIRIQPAFDEPIIKEIETPTTWTTAYFIPFSVFEHHLGELGVLPGQTWRGNFYKCADASSHPHWGAWAPIGEKLAFHQPAIFGVLKFEK